MRYSGRQNNTLKEQRGTVAIINVLRSVTNNTAFFLDHKQLPAAPYMGEREMPEHYITTTLLFLRPDINSHSK